MSDKGLVDRAELCQASRLEPSQADAAIAALSSSPMLVHGRINLIFSIESVVNVRPSPSQANTYQIHILHRSPPF